MRLVLTFFVNIFCGLLVSLLLLLLQVMGNTCSSSLIDMSWSGIGIIILLLIVAAAGFYFYSRRVHRHHRRRVYRDSGFDMDLYREFQDYRDSRTRTRSIPTDHRPALGYIAPHPPLYAQPPLPLFPRQPAAHPSAKEELLLHVQRLLEAGPPVDAASLPQPSASASSAQHSASATRPSLSDPVSRNADWSNYE